MISLCVQVVSRVRVVCVCVCVCVRVFLCLCLCDCVLCDCVSQSRIPCLSVSTFLCLPLSSVLVFGVSRGAPGPPIPVPSVRPALGYWVKKGVGLVHFPLEDVAKINTLWPWLWLCPYSSFFVGSLSHLYPPSGHHSWLLVNYSSSYFVSEHFSDCKVTSLSGTFTVHNQSSLCLLSSVPVHHSSMMPQAIITIPSQSGSQSTIAQWCHKQSSLCLLSQGSSPPAITSVHTCLLHKHSSIE